MIRAPQPAARNARATYTIGEHAPSPRPPRHPRHIKMAPLSFAPASQCINPPSPSPPFPPATTMPSDYPKLPTLRSRQTDFPQCTFPSNPLPRPPTSSANRNRVRRRSDKRDQERHDPGGAFGARAPADGARGAADRDCARRCHRELVVR